MLKAVHLKVNYTKPEYAVCDTQSPVFTWGIEDWSKEPCGQSGYRIVVSHHDAVLWDSGYCESCAMRAVYAGSALPSGALVHWKLQVTDCDGKVSRFTESYFKTACFEDFYGTWIEPAFDSQHAVVHFKKEFTVEELPKRAVLYYCGLGLSKPYINENALDDFRLQPAYTNYQKQAQYIVEPVDVSNFKCGMNVLEIAVAGGWRKNYGSYLENISSDRPIEFMGNICLWCQLVVYDKDGKETVVSSDTSWSCAVGNRTYSHLFNGETFDETACITEWKKVTPSQFAPFELKAQCIEPICVKREIMPINSYVKNGACIYDFGENLAGVTRLRVKGEGKNLSFILRHAEELTEDGLLFTDTLRSAKATDRYLCRDGECDIDFSPMFTYHGFRFTSLEIQGEFSGEIELTALSFYTDIDTETYFRCGNQTMNEIYKSMLRTERCNLHSVATDCPQRDERLAWMNDATVRFMSMPYHFHIARLFEKIADDIVNEQAEDGSLTCTAPFVYGERPADPVCAAYLIAVLEYYKLTGDDRLIQKHYDGMERWTDCLKKFAPDGIVDYSYYGDWAGPADCCYSTETIGNSDVLKKEEYDPGAACSLTVPGEMVSTAIYYMNLRLMEYFGNIIGRNVEKFIAEKKRVQKAYLEKWFNAETISIGNNAQGECALSLYVGILPKESEIEIAKKWHLLSWKRVRELLLRILRPLCCLTC